MAVDMSFLQANPDYYERWTNADPGRRYQPGAMPGNWQRRESGAWTHWTPTGHAMAGQGWKVHVSASLPNTRAVLAVVAVACVELDVPFKHLAGQRAFLVLHDKHGDRVQAGKFCALYPADQDLALRLMRRLESDLAGISGPFVLTDRRFGASECVSYRYGAFQSRSRINAGGEQVELMLDPAGELIEDPRLPYFRLPDGMTDPFRPAPDAGAKPTPAKAAPITMHGYTFRSVIQHSNAGGAYRFRSAEGDPVFVKEARALNGYTAQGDDAKRRLEAEYLVLRAIHGQQPGLCPRPLELFDQWEHRYLATELVVGLGLFGWMVRNNPVMSTAPTVISVAEYHQRCQAILDQLDDQLDRLHALGYLFVDLSPNNIMIDDEDGDRVRLVDFEAVQPIDDVRQVMGTPGYQHPDPNTALRSDPIELDRYGLAAIALMLLFPIQEAAERHWPVLDHLHADLAELGPVPPRLWRRATEFYRRAESTHELLSPDEVRADPRGALGWLADRTADALQAMAEPDHPDRVYPTSPIGYRTDTRAVAAGTAGVLHALHLAGRPIEPAVLARLRDEALTAAAASAPGLLYGSAGIACVLAELGEVEVAGKLLEVAAGHPLNGSSASLGGGAAGTAYGLLRCHRLLAEPRWVEQAGQLLAAVPDGDELTGWLGPTAKSGLVGGRTGIALALHQFHLATGDELAFQRGMRLLGEELRFAEPLPVDGLGFKQDSSELRVLPYLFVGSAGYASVLARYLAVRPDAEFTTAAEFEPAEALERCLRVCAIRFCALPGLMSGLAGLTIALAGAGDRLGRPELREQAITNACGLFRFAAPGGTGVRWLSDPGQRLAADLWGGSAGILTALTTLINPASAGVDLLSPADVAD